MITGHLGIAAAVRGRWRDTSLLWLLAASVAPDAWDVALALAGVCSPFGLYSHTVPAAALIAAVVAGAALLATGSRATAIACVALVLVHLPPDMITGHKLYWPGGSLIGLNVYARPALDFIIELPILAAGWWLLRRARATPAWLCRWEVLLSLALLQASFDFVSGFGLIKPTACA